MNTLWKIWLFTLLCSLTCISCSRSTQPLSGYIEGEYTYIATSIAGTLFTLDVSRGQTVATNQLLFTLDPQPDKAAMEAAEANIKQLEAEIVFSKVQMQRQQALYATKNTEKATLDQATTDFRSKNQQLSSLKAALAQALWALQQKTVYSPAYGYVFDTFYRVGEKVAANQPVLAILRPENIKVLFYIPETQLSAIHLGQTIWFECDGCKQKTKATINYISSEAEYTPPIIYSADTRYKLVYLIRAEIPANIAASYHPGQPVDIYLHE